MPTVSAVASGILTVILALSLRITSANSSLLFQYPAKHIDTEAKVDGPGGSRRREGGM